ncbi:head GIN domain-containing protein [Novosphingobium cyanobacteriorum]|uniref:DUF2807 domain-containing protein n=1 Tax=Novosphingobium cyanobacteriorum TaxID=3024215 RepID=A0ABT6CGW1_9SPHN|nr:head GIN domain-containing protein [Novosphingobium cyanobacteriorum]MDF8333016.1 DUF2807 domain-containing protein [Novosphingobium cyanobacteriorum]
MIKDIARTLAGVTLMGIALATAGCEATPMSIDGHKGVPLSQLDMGGTPPDEITLLGPDTVRIVPGDVLAITVEGDPLLKEHLRFVRHEGKLGIGRDGGTWAGTATINVTVPAARRLILAGSGTIQADVLKGDDVGVTIAGSGDVNAAQVEAKDLKVEVLGSGTLKAAGRTDALKLTLAGSGDALMPGLAVGDAKVDVAGSGSANFASDGNVKASIMGSGEVRVKGRATCKVSAMGSGKLVCEP